MLQVAPGRLSHIIICSYHSLRRFKRCFHSKRRDSLYDVFGCGLVDPYSSDSYALARPNVGIVAATLIAMCVTRGHSIEHMHDPSAAPAANEACQ
jgi:hypothetical protein